MLSILSACRLLRPVPNSVAITLNSIIHHFRLTSDKNIHMGMVLIVLFYLFIFHVFPLFIVLFYLFKFHVFPLFISYRLRSRLHSCAIVHVINPQRLPSTEVLQRVAITHYQSVTSQQTSLPLPSPLPHLHLPLWVGHHHPLLLPHQHLYE